MARGISAGWAVSSLVPYTAIVAWKFRKGLEGTTPVALRQEGVRVVDVACFRVSPILSKLEFDSCLSRFLGRMAGPLLVVCVGSKKVVQ